MNQISIHDWAAAGVSLILTGGIVALALLGKAIPADMGAALGLSLGWIFRAASTSAPQGNLSAPPNVPTN